MLIKSTNDNIDLSRYNEIVKDPFFIKNPNLFEIFKMGLPPKEAYLYFPKGEEIIIHNTKKPEKALRLIYHKVPLTELEKKWLSEFKEIINSHPENRPPDFWNDGYNLSYIYSTECKLDKAYERMIDYFKWYYKHFPMNLQPQDKVIKLLNTGFTYIFGRDHHFRPIIICQPYIIAKYKHEYSEEDVINACIFICQYMANYMLIPGQVENWIMFINLDKTSLFRLPESFKKTAKILSNYFIARLYKSYILGMNVILRIVFNILCSFLEEVTVQKFVILTDRKDPKLFQGINPQNLEQRFGGTAPDCIYDEEFCLFPPRMPCNYYFKEDENPKEILITENEYIEKYYRDEIMPESVSPFIIGRIRQEELLKEKDEINRRKREEAKEKMKDAKTKEELNLSTTWKSKDENFDLNKFKIKSPGLMNGLKNIINLKNKFIDKTNNTSKSLISDDVNEIFD